MVKYKVNYYWLPEVEKVIVEKETESFVWIKGWRKAKKTHGIAFFDTFQEAKDFLVDVFEKKAQSIRHQLEQANRHLENAKGLKDV